VKERLESGNPNLEKDFQSARHDFDAATDSLASISPVPPAMTKADDLIKESCSAWHGFSFRLNQDYSRIFGGDETESYSKDVMAKYDEGTHLFDEAVVETGHVADSYRH